MPRWNARAHFLSAKQSNWQIDGCTRSQLCDDCSTMPELAWSTNSLWCVHDCDLSPKILTTPKQLCTGHPDLIRGDYARFHFGLSKASPEKNLSEDIFFGYDALLRGQSTTWSEICRFGKGREVALSTCTIFEDKLARGAAMTLRSSDVYRLNRELSILHRLSVMMGSIAHYLYTLLFDVAITSFVWIVVLLACSSITSEQMGLLGSVYAIPWLFHLGFSFGLPLLFQLCLERDLLSAIILWLQNLLFGAFYYLFQVRTKAYGFLSGLQGGSSSYASTGRG